MSDKKKRNGHGCREVRARRLIWLRAGTRHLTAAAFAYYVSDLEGMSHCLAEYAAPLRRRTEEAFSIVRVVFVRRIPGRTVLFNPGFTLAGPQQGGRAAWP